MFWSFFKRAENQLSAFLSLQNFTGPYWNLTMSTSLASLTKKILCEGWLKYDWWISLTHSNHSIFWFSSGLVEFLLPMPIVNVNSRATLKTFQSVAVNHTKNLLAIWQQKVYLFSVYWFHQFQYIFPVHKLCLFTYSKRRCLHFLLKTLQQ